MSDLSQSLAGYGLFASHAVALSGEDIQQFGFAEHESGLLLVGNRGSSYWPVFSLSSEFADGAAHPLDRWSKRVAADICAEFDGFRPLFPSDGPPFLPFQRWALAAGPLSQSPLGLLIHPDYGLWHSFRFALLFDLSNHSFAQATAEPPPSPCLSCAEQPCLHSCPVNAFTEQGYDYLGCAEYLNSRPDADCHEWGCQARNACPAGSAYRYDPAQHRFHLQAFIAAR